MNASDIGPIGPGVEIFGSTGGEFSLIDILEHCARELGAPDISVVTWTAGPAHLVRLRALADAAPRLVVDATYPGTKPEYCAEAVRLFGAEAIRLTRTHAKFALLSADGVRLVLRSSMNLNQNKRAELFAISDDAALYERLDAILVPLFAEHDGATQIREFRRQHNASFSRRSGGLTTRRGNLGEG